MFGRGKELKMKKLFILGGTRFTIPIIKEAKRLGIYTFTLDYLPDNIAHKFSDEYINVSVIDKEKVLCLAKKNRIDGIISFACDAGAVTAAYVAEKMNLPNVGPYASVCILQNKGKFRSFLKDNDFNVPYAKGYSSIDEAIEDVNSFSFPVIVKPIDSAGSKGVKRVDNKKDLVVAIKNALYYSLSNEFIIEEFIEKEGDSSDCDCFSIDGKMVYFSFNSQKFDNSSSNPFVPAGFSWPCEWNNKHQEKLKKEIQRLLDLLKMKTAVYNIETRVGKDNKEYIMEVSPRGGGNRLSECIKLYTEVDLITNIVRYSVGMEMISFESKSNSNYLVEVILHSQYSGDFKELIISNEIVDYVIEEDIWVNKGDPIKDYNSGSDAIGTLIMQFDTKEMKDYFFNRQNELIKVIVE